MAIYSIVMWNMYTISHWVAYQDTRKSLLSEGVVLTST